MPLTEKPPYKQLRILCVAIPVSVLAQERRLPSPSGQSQPEDPLIVAARRWDLNGDGVYTCENWRIYLARIFMIADHNHDRYLDEDEFQAVRAADPIFADAGFSVFDANGDGRISRAEFMSVPNPLFAIYDRDKTCRVTQTEIDAVKAASQAQPQKKSGHGGGRKGTSAGALL
jgi:hypothetical protein